MLKLVTAYGAVAAGAGLGVWIVYSPTVQAVRRRLERKVAEATAKLSDMYVWLPAQRLWMSYVFSPLGCGWIGWSLLRHWLGAAIGLAVGLVVPELVIRWMQHLRRQRFNDQLVEALMVLSSSLRAGLSMIQSFEVLVEEMPAPMAQEVAMVLKEHRMGVPLQEALLHLKARMPSDDLSMMVTTILVSRETGGDITQLFMRLVETIRERNKLRQRLRSLTLLPRMQGVILVLLPVGFAFMAYQSNPRYFDIFFDDIVGRMLLCGAIAAEVMGALLIWRFSRPPVY